MLAPEITLDAALRDVSSNKDQYRFQAAANLARALLHELGQPGPRWQAATEHPRGEAVLQALRGLLDERETAVLRGTAAVGLGLLGDAEVLEATAPWLGLTGDREDLAFLRESAMMAATRLHRAATDAGVEPALRREIQAHVETALHAEAPDLRYQGALALVEIAGEAAEDALVEALAREELHAVREGLVEAIAYLDPPGPRACEALEALVAGPEGMETLGFEAAVTLAAARRASARPRLLQALVVRAHRDRALEALAALAGGGPEEIEIVQRLAQRWWLSSITRVRAAYALARMAPGGEDPGRRLLERLRWHPRAAVREAVRDAFANLELLASRDRANHATPPH